MPPGSRSVSGPLSDPEFVAGLRPVPSGVGGQPVTWPAVDVEGVTTEGAPIRVALDAASGPVLLAFLATHCDGCDTFWNGLGRAVRRPLAESGAMSSS